MKNMFKISLLLVAIMELFSTNSMNAQKTAAPNTYEQGFRLGFGVNAGAPTSNPYDFALGGDVRLQYDLSQKTSLTLTTGFTNLFIGDGAKDLGFIPAKAGFKGFIWEDRFYIMGEAGAAFAVTNGYNETSFLWAPSIGYANKYVDISIRYEDYQKFNTGQVALRLAYGFKL